MSTIFTTTPVCKICKTREPKKDPRDNYKDRCEYCDLRHDSEGYPFIVYSTVYVFAKQKYDRQNFWVLDGIVRKAFGRWKHLEGIFEKDLEEVMTKRNYRLIDVQEPVFK